MEKVFTYVWGERWIGTIYPIPPNVGARFPLYDMDCELRLLQFGDLPSLNVLWVKRRDWFATASTDDIMALPFLRFALGRQEVLAEVTVTGRCNFGEWINRLDLRSLEHYSELDERYRPPTALVSEFWKRENVALAWDPREERGYGPLFRGRIVVAGRRIYLFIGGHSDIVVLADAEKQ